MIKNLKHIPNKALWMKPKKRVIKQFIVSTFSYLTTPFAKSLNQKEAIRRYFNKAYYEKPDELIFDGNDFSYYNLIALISKKNIFRTNVVDLGCGMGSFYRWMRGNDISFESYLGIDLVIKEKTLSHNSKLMQMDICEFNKFPSDNLVILCNTLCYLNEEDTKHILSKKDISSFIIIEPYPGLFWDAHFSGIKLFYRKPYEILEMLNLNQYKECKISIDYWCKTKSTYHLPLSYCLYISKKE